MGDHSDGMPSTLALYQQLSDGHSMAMNLIENMGYRIGQRCIESPRFTSEIEIVKFICRGYWSHLFQKDINTLKTNNAMLIFHILPESSKILAFACGLLRGGLSSLGVSCIVNAEIPKIPTCHFTVRVSSRSKTSEL
ncbi:Trafficking protein particle complex subunit 6B [Taenia crassiceps]|uniref:Trafficking protein particle complex subunit 6B n=1 Tax=Taenia crassiceps TaxID=6207 RepID=A0ABR4QFN9_9CEST